MVVFIPATRPVQPSLTHSDPLLPTTTPHNPITNPLHNTPQGILNLKSFLGLWYSRLFVLSKYGFLHYFGDDLLVPEGTLQLSKCRIEGAEEPDTFVLTEVNMLLDSHNVIKCNSKDEMLLWVAELRDFCRK